MLLTTATSGCALTISSAMALEVKETGRMFQNVGCGYFSTDLRSVGKPSWKHHQPERGVEGPVGHGAVSERAIPGRDVPNCYL